ncbi:MAG TPA: hypothetical protein H9665_02560 [Firmicutes bacterium]|jgi:lipoprotein|nr:hypothetical protein [Bacillota bacterium]
MVKQKSTLKAALAVLLALLTITTAVLLAACDTGTLDEDSMPTIHVESEDESSGDESSASQTQPGYADTPEIRDIVNITPDTIFVTGLCQEGATVTITGGTEDVVVESLNGYFVAEVGLINTTSTLFEAVASVEGLEDSEPAGFRGQYNATAEKRVDGNGVTVGLSSRLFFDRGIAEYTGQTLMTMSQLRAYREYVDSRVAALERRSGGSAISLVYVYIPDYATIYSEYMPASAVKETTTTRLEQISENLNGSDAVILDMTDVLLAAKEEGEYPVYNVTDGHLSEYGGYLVYKAICDVMAVEYPDAAARALDEFDITYETKDGGSLVHYLGADKTVIRENAVVLTPKFTLNLGMGGATGINISEVTKYEEDSVAMYTGTEERNTTERVIFGTGRTNLPSALIYRDDSVLPFYDILAERFNNVMFSASGDFTINMADAERYSGGTKALVDYVIMIVSETNVDKTFGS